MAANADGVSPALQLLVKGAGTIIHQSNVYNRVSVCVYHLLSCFYHACVMYWCLLLVVAVKISSFFSVYFYY